MLKTWKLCDPSEYQNVLNCTRRVSSQYELPSHLCWVGQIIGGALTILGFLAILAAFCTLVYMTVEGNRIVSAATTVRFTAEA